MGAADGLAMDVKYGNGAFMSSLESAEELAAALVEVAEGAGMPTRALLTDMGQPLASAAGVYESVPLGATAGCEENRLLLSFVTVNVSPWLPSSPSSRSVAQRTLCAPASSSTV